GRGATPVAKLGRHRHVVLGGPLPQLDRVHEQALVGAMDRQAAIPDPAAGGALGDAEIADRLREAQPHARPPGGGPGRRAPARETHRAWQDARISAASPAPPRRKSVCTPPSLPPRLTRTTPRAKTCGPPPEGSAPLRSRR